MVEEEECDQDQADALVYSAESSEPRHFHSHPSLLPHAANHHYCAISLNWLLWSRPLVRRRWLRRVRTAQANFLRNESFQQSITKYSQPTPVTPPVPRNQDGQFTHDETEMCGYLIRNLPETKTPKNEQWWLGMRTSVNLEFSFLKCISQGILFI
jgi:hypothetical protein